MKAVPKGFAGGTALTLLLSGCVGPVGPSPGLVPPPTSPAVMSDDITCRQYADAQIAPMRDQANAQGFGSALVGAGLGAALGAAVGGGRGAAIGAASGGILGTGVGAANAQNATGYLQQQYNMFYANCMAARGGGPGFSGPPGAGPGYGGPPGAGPGYGAPPPGAALPPPPRY